jgi:uncharacterized protein
MTKPEHIVADVLAAAGGEIIGRVRIQKLFYLLKQLGMSSDLSFRYHYYGPYSRDLDEAIDRAKAFHNVKEEIDYRKSDGMPYSIFKGPTGGAPGLSEIKVDEVKKHLVWLKSQPSTILELAATIHWLNTVEGVEDWRPELEKRKGTKTVHGRTDKAIALLISLGLAPR